MRLRISFRKVLFWEGCIRISSGSYSGILRLYTFSTETILSVAFFFFFPWVFFFFLVHKQ